MKTPLRIALLAGLVLAAGCVKNKPFVELVGVCAPPGADACTFSDTCDNFSIGAWVFDNAAAGDRMWMIVEVKNQLLDNTNPGTGRVNSHDAFMEEVTIEYEGPVAVPSATYRMQNVVLAGGSSVVSLYVLPEGPAAAINATALPAGLTEIIAKPTIRGKLGDGSSFETGNFEIPIKLCTGCLAAAALPTCAAGEVLVTCPPGAVSAAGLLSQNLATAACVTP
ncbi:MAG: hypothetical protein U0229_12755 [Anaeromyxobacter sp.]